MKNDGNDIEFILANVENLETPEDLNEAVRRLTNE